MWLYQTSLQFFTRCVTDELCPFSFPLLCAIPVYVWHCSKTTSWQETQQSHGGIFLWVCVPCELLLRVWQIPRAGSLHVQNLMSCQMLLNVRKSRGKCTVQNMAQTEINSLACSISQLIFHEGFSPSPPPVFFRLWNDQCFPRGR